MTIIPFWGVSWESNSYLIVSQKHAALIDAGVDVGRVEAALASEDASLDYILLTHGHFDHTLSVDRLRGARSAPLVVHAADAEMLTDAEKSAQYLFFGTKDAHAPADKTVTHGDVLPLGDTVIRVYHTPGHSLGSVCYGVENALFSGDTLFAGGYGRCDLYGGDINALAHSLGSLRELDPSLTIYPGHGGSATLGDALNNLFGLT